MTAQEAISLAVAIAIFVLKPGPGIALIITRAALLGFWGGFSISLGAFLVEGTYLALVMGGLSVAGEHLRAVTVPLKLIAGGYLIYLGVHTMRQADPMPAQAADGRASPVRGGIAAGMMLSLSSPISILFYAGIVPTILSAGPYDLRATATALAVLAATGWTITASMSALAHRLGDWLTRGAAAARFRRGAGAAIALIGGLLIASGLSL